ncbi:hypothetical protein PHISCL_02631 [Aspergillus sclerotialis]|uniref:N-acetyltransferase domain-containing protein n=1 Tax=Aspergillus sclerotialis TaxID=2070753 RepID=A0A3A2ZPD1_9EURO|nr:hypothetical protein PHISCL_02631 [Aspergillus sclerotialis]
MPARSLEPTTHTVATDSPKQPHSPEPLSFETKVYSSSELLTQPWLPALTRAVNEGFSTNSGPINFAQRLSSDIQLSEELGEAGFTAIAFASRSEHSDQSDEVDIIGTASVKGWVNDRDWLPYPTPTPGSHESSGLDGANGNGCGKAEMTREQDPCDGDYEIALVTIKPGANYRKRGIAESLIKACERELVRRLTLQGDKRRSIKLMVKIVKEVNGPYWLKKGFTTVGQKWSPKGTWGSFQEFTMWAMMRELPIE